MAICTHIKSAQKSTSTTSFGTNNINIIGFKPQMCATSSLFDASFRAAILHFRNSFYQSVRSLARKNSLTHTILNAIFPSKRYPASNIFYNFFDFHKNRAHQGLYSLWFSLLGNTGYIVATPDPSSRNHSDYRSLRYTYFHGTSV